MESLAIAGGVVSLLGAIFLLLGALGLLRMPDPYNRIQAGTKASTLGTLLLLAGLGMSQPEWAPRLGLLALFVLLTNPVSSHVLARAALKAQVPLTPGTLRDPALDELEHEPPEAPQEADHA